MYNLPADLRIYLGILYSFNYVYFDRTPPVCFTRSYINVCVIMCLSKKTHLSYYLISMFPLSSDDVHKTRFKKGHRTAEKRIKRTGFYVAGKIPLAVSTKTVLSGCHAYCLRFDL